MKSLSSHVLSYKRLIPSQLEFQLPIGIEKKEPLSQTLTRSQNCNGPSLYLGGDLLSFIVVLWGLGEVGKPIRGVRVLSRKVVLSEAGNVVVSMVPLRVMVEGRRSGGGWVGVVEEIFSRLLG